MVLGCAKGEEIDLNEVVILPVLPPSAPDASVDGGSEPAATTREVSTTAQQPATSAVAETPDASPDTEASDAARPVPGDSGT